MVCQVTDRYARDLIGSGKALREMRPLEPSSSTACVAWVWAQRFLLLHSGVTGAT